MATVIDLQLEKFFKETVATRPQRKFEETLTSFDRRVFWYDRDEVGRQAERLKEYDEESIIGYEDHRKAVETAVNILHAKTQHDITMEILTNRFFKVYRTNLFKGMGNFNDDYSFVIRKVAMLFNPHKGHINRVHIGTKLSTFKKPTLVQINHIIGSVSEVTLPNNSLTLQEWAQRYNAGSPESTTYQVAGLNLAA